MAVALVCNMVPVVNQKLTQRLVLELVHSRPCQYHNIEVPEYLSMMPKALSDHSFYPVAADRLPDSPTRDGHTKTRLVKTIQGGKHT